MTPSIPQRSAPLSSNLTPIAEAQVRLHVSAVPRYLPCREEEFDQVSWTMYRNSNQYRCLLEDSAFAFLAIYYFS